jgi:hypothetical protein
VHVPKWSFLLLPLAAVVAAAAKEYPAMVRYWRIRRM